MKLLTAIVLQGINNIYRVRTDDGEVLQCRIKGKTLTETERAYNPLAPGDAVMIQQHSRTEGMVVSRNERTNSFVRWNMKKDLPQTIAANIDMLWCVTSTQLPKFRAKFIDRVCVCAQHVPVTIIVNKWDLGCDEETREYIELYRSIGYDVLHLSSFDQAQIRDLGDRLKGTRSVFFGQSGVGKSTLINALIPEANQKTGEISDKYDRGRHTTNFAKWIESDTFSIIDTPGVREIEVPIMDPYEIASHFPEIEQASHQCRFSPCMHIEEPGCAVLEAVEDGRITYERYESYLKIALSMIERRKKLYYGV